MPRQPDALIRTEPAPHIPSRRGCAHSLAFASSKCPPALRLTDSARPFSKPVRTVFSSLSADRTLVRSGQPEPPSPIPCLHKAKPRPATIRRNVLAPVRRLARFYRLDLFD
ncbi:hypothetical protein F2981_07830 [Sinorhizobium meliloti]|nr:hypothetical protein [Sinorhizobium meliloti]